MDCHALIIEDNPYNAEVLERLLTVENVSSHRLQDIEQLHGYMQMSVTVDVVFLDLEMPKLNGYEVLKLLKEEYGLKSPVVAYTVHTSEVDVVRDVGFDSFLGKPLDPVRFPALLAKILNGEDVWEIPW